jgi:hypothetical protein
MMPGGAETLPFVVISPWAAPAGRAAMPTMSVETIVKTSDQIPEPALAGERCAVCMTFPYLFF